MNTDFVLTVEKWKAQASAISQGLLAVHASAMAFPFEFEMELREFHAYQDVQKDEPLDSLSISRESGLEFNGGDFSRLPIVVKARIARELPAMLDSILRRHPLPDLGPAVEALSRVIDLSDAEATEDATT